MPKLLNFQCLECSRHPTDWAKTIHGETGDGCWNPKRCYVGEALPLGIAVLFIVTEVKMLLPLKAK